MLKGPESDEDHQFPDCDVRTAPGCRGRRSDGTSASWASAAAVMQPKCSRCSPTSYAAKVLGSHAFSQFARDFDSPKPHQVRSLATAPPLWEFNLDGERRWNKPDIHHRRSQPPTPRDDEADNHDIDHLGDFDTATTTRKTTVEEYHVLGSVGAARAAIGRACSWPIISPKSTPETFHHFLRFAVPELHSEKRHTACDARNNAFSLLGHDISRSLSQISQEVWEYIPFLFLPPKNLLGPQHVLCLVHEPGF